MPRNVNFEPLGGLGAYSIAQFCKAHGIGRTTFWAWSQRRIAPKVTKLGRRSLIFVSDYEAWQAAARSGQP